MRKATATNPAVSADQTASTPAEKVALLPQRSNGRERVVQIMEAAAKVIYERGFEAATMKEIADHIRRPAHRIIHLCESSVIRPTVDANGRGSVRRFSRDDTFRILLALELQEAGVEVPLIKPLMDGLDRLMEIAEIKLLKSNSWRPRRKSARCRRTWKSSKRRWKNLI